MKRILLLLLPLLLIPLYGNIDREIQLTQKKISKKKIERKRIEKRLDQIAAAIAKERKRVEKIKEEILRCKANIKIQKRKSRIKKGELDKIDKLYKALKKREESVSRKLTEILAKQISIEMLLSAGSDHNGSLPIYETNIDNIILQQIYENYRKLLKEKFAKTKSRFLKLSNNLKLVKSELKKIAFTLNDLKSEEQRLKRLNKAKTKTITRLNKEKAAYIRKLERIRKEKETIIATLNRLNITKREKESHRIQGSATDINVRKLGTSYQPTKVLPYTGPKTIAPLSDYTLVQKFGNYTDPLYHIKIFNESVILRSNTPNPKVRSVFDGKVIYASKTPMLDHVVIIKHAGNLHTIYAHLSQIAPTIKIGRRIKKGYVIGRTKRDLTFEVTKNEGHINPMQLIR
ncbi:MAG: hypothetical protein B6D59_00030 [Campylobacteraceae bacterium 4484_4]|nr:MAG: hypothetical protein B6D59_00030 [Campylobacteraceae bacterium 4484_4]